MNKLKNGNNKNDNYTITFKIDADIEDYLKNIEMVSFIENMKKGAVKSVTKTDFVNSLIRANMYRILGLNTTNQEIIDRTWENYKKANGIGETNGNNK